MMNQWIQSENNLVERVEIRATSTLLFHGLGQGEKIKKKESGWEKGGRRRRRGEKRKEGGERGDKRFIKVKQLWTTAKVVSTNSVCFLDLTGFMFHILQNISHPKRLMNVFPL